MSTFKHPIHFDGFTRPPLEPFGREGKICLDKNEAPFSLIDVCPEKVGSILSTDLRTYPDPYPLYVKLAAHLGVSMEQILITYGSEQAIRYCFELTIEAGDQVITLDPTFAMVSVFINQFRAKKRLIPYDNTLAISAERVAEEISPQTKLIIVANPNNPSGSVFSLSELRLIAAAARKNNALFLVDEVYAAYAGVTALPLLDEFPNLAIAQSFSKSWGLAGIRVGYLLAQPDTIQLFRRLKPIDEMTAPSLSAALLALETPELLERNVTQVRKWQDEFSKLHHNEISYIPSHANFILLKVSERVRENIRAYFSAERILAKLDFGPGAFQSIIRFSVTNDRVMSSLYQKFKEC